MDSVSYPICPALHLGAAPCSSVLRFHLYSSLFFLFWIVDGSWCCEDVCSYTKSGNKYLNKNKKIKPLLGCHHCLCPQALPNPRGVPGVRCRAGCLCCSVRGHPWVPLWGAGAWLGPVPVEVSGPYTPVFTPRGQCWLLAPCNNSHWAGTTLSAFIVNEEIIKSILQS